MLQKLDSFLDSLIYFYKNSRIRLAKKPNNNNHCNLCRGKPASVHCLIRFWRCLKFTLWNPWQCSAWNQVLWRTVVELRLRNIPATFYYFGWVFEDKKPFKPGITINSSSAWAYTQPKLMWVLNSSMMSNITFSENFFVVCCIAIFWVSAIFLLFWSSSSVRASCFDTESSFFSTSLNSSLTVSDSELFSRSFDCWFLTDKKCMYLEHMSTLNQIETFYLTMSYTGTQYF